MYIEDDGRLCSLWPFPLEDFFKILLSSGRLDLAAWNPAKPKLECRSAEAPPGTLYSQHGEPAVDQGAKRVTCGAVFFEPHKKTVEHQ